MVNLGLIDFQLSLPLIINKNNGQNKFEVHIFLMATFWHKIGRDTTFAPILIGHNSAIFYSILTIEHNR